MSRVLAAHNRRSSVRTEETSSSRSPAKGGAHWTADGDLGQRSEFPSTSSGGLKLHGGFFGDARSGEVYLAHFNLCGDGLGLKLVSLPGYSPDFGTDEAMWGVREEAAGNLCLEAGRRCCRGSANSAWAGRPERGGKKTLLDGPAEKKTQSCSAPGPFHPNAHIPSLHWFGCRRLPSVLIVPTVPLLVMITGRWCGIPFQPPPPVPCDGF